MSDYYDSDELADLDEDDDEISDFSDDECRLNSYSNVQPYRPPENYLPKNITNGFMILGDSNLQLYHQSNIPGKKEVSPLTLCWCVKASVRACVARFFSYQPREASPTIFIIVGTHEAMEYVTSGYNKDEYLRKRIIIPLISLIHSKKVDVVHLFFVLPNLNSRVRNVLQSFCTFVNNLCYGAIRHGFLTASVVDNLLRHPSGKLSVRGSEKLLNTISHYCTLAKEYVVVANYINEQCIFEIKDEVGKLVCV